MFFLWVVFLTPPVVVYIDGDGFLSLTRKSMEMVLSLGSVELWKFKIKTFIIILYWVLSFGFCNNPILSVIIWLNVAFIYLSHCLVVPMNFLTLFLSFSLASKQIMEFVAQILQNQKYIYVKKKKTKKKLYYKTYNSIMVQNFHSPQTAYDVQNLLTLFHFTLAQQWKPSTLITKDRERERECV